jgi:hypothetical protein
MSTTQIQSKKLKIDNYLNKIWSELHLKVIIKGQWDNFIPQVKWGRTLHLD